MTLRLSNVEAMKGPAESVKLQHTGAKREVQSVYRVIQCCQYVITRTHARTRTHAHTQITV
jgi:hypothetical protein